MLTQLYNVLNLKIAEFIQLFQKNFPGHSQDKILICQNTYTPHKYNIKIRISGSLVTPSAWLPVL